MSSSATNTQNKMNPCGEFPAVFLDHYLGTNTYYLDMNNNQGRQRIEISEEDAIKFSEKFKIEIKTK